MIKVLHLKEILILIPEHILRLVTAQFSLLHGHHRQVMVVSFKAILRQLQLTQQPYGMTL